MYSKEWLDKIKKEKPDLVIGPYTFYFRQMLQYNAHTDAWYTVEIGKIVAFKCINDIMKDLTREEINLVSDILVQELEALERYDDVNVDQIKVLEAILDKLN